MTAPLSLNNQNFTTALRNVLLQQRSHKYRVLFRTQPFNETHRGQKRQNQIYYHTYPDLLQEICFPHRISKCSMFHVKSTFMSNINPANALTSFKCKLQIPQNQRDFTVFYTSKYEFFHLLRKKIGWNLIMFVFLGQGCSLQTKPVTSSGLSLERLSEGLGFFFQEVFFDRTGGGGRQGRKPQTGIIFFAPGNRPGKPQKGQKDSLQSIIFQGRVVKFWRLVNFQFLGGFVDSQTAKLIKLVCFLSCIQIYIHTFLRAWDLEMTDFNREGKQVGLFKNISRPF